MRGPSIRSAASCTPSLTVRPAFTFFSDADADAPSGPATPLEIFADDEALMAIDDDEAAAAAASAELPAIEGKENTVPAPPRPAHRLNPLASASRRGSVVGSGSPLARPPLELPDADAPPRPSTPLDDPLPPLPPSPAGSELAAARAAKRPRRGSSS